MNNLNLIIGEDSKLINFYLFDILKKINYQDEVKISYNMNESSLSDILDEASMISLFSSVKVIVGNDFNISNISDSDYDYLSRYVNNINKDVYIILIANKVDARSKIYKLFKDKFNIIDVSKSDNTDNIKDYIKNKVKDKGYKIDSINIECLLSRIGNDINNINLELEKLFIYKSDSKMINREDIQLLTVDSIDNVIYEFTNSIYDNDYNKIVKMYKDFKIENIGFDYLISVLANSFRQSLIVKILSNRGESNFNIAKVIGKKEYFVKKLLERIYRYTVDDLASYINKLAVIEREYKMGKSNIDKLELFLLWKES